MGAIIGLKQCSKCGQWKNEEEFNWRWKALGKRHAACRACHKLERDNYYENTREKYIAGVMISKNARREEGRRYINDYLSTHLCVDCGEGDPVVLEFNHVRGKKRDSIAQLIVNSSPIEVIQAEIDKCDVVCSNCHRRRTAKQFGWKKGKH